MANFVHELIQFSGNYCIIKFTPLDHSPNWLNPLSVTVQYCLSN